MKLSTMLYLFSLGISLSFCNDIKPKEKEIVKKNVVEPMMNHSMMEKDERVSLKLNPMQKSHQLMNMRSLLEAVQHKVTQHFLHKPLSTT